MSYPLNEQIVHRFLDACISRKYKKLNDYLSEDIIFHIPGRNVLGGNHNGPAALVKLCIRARQQMQSYPLMVTHIHTVSGPTYVASTSFGESTVDRVTINWQARTLFFFRAQLIAACWLFIDDQNAFDRYWSQPLPSVTEPIRHSKPNTYPGLINFAYSSVDL